MRSSLVPVLVVLTLFTGCEGSPVPLAEPDPALYNESLLGSWVSDAESSDEYSDRLYLRLFAFNETEYYAEVRTDDDEPDEWMRLRIYPTELEGFLFANIQCVGCDEREWLFFSYELQSEDALAVTSLNDAIYEEDVYEGITMPELRAAVVSRISANTLFDETKIFIPWTADPEEQ